MSEDTTKTPQKSPEPSETRESKDAVASQKEKAKSIKKDSSGKSADRAKMHKMEVRLDLNALAGRWLGFAFLALLFVPFFINLFTNQSSNAISLSELVRDVREKKVKSVEVAGQNLNVQYTDGSTKRSRKEDGQEVVRVLNAANLDLKDVNVVVKDVGFAEVALQIFLNILPLVGMVVIFAIIMRQARGAQDGVLGFGRSKAKLFIKGKQDVKFSDVGGMDEAKKELEEVVDFMKEPKKYKKLGARTPKGVLLIGPSGTGKTLLARAVAGEANVQFLSMAGSEFMEMLVGVGASRVRDLFSTAKKAAPSIIFIDEIDAIGRVRGHGSMGGHDEREQTLNQILVEMDGFTPNDNVLVIAATNRGDMLDPALVRPGRFDRRVQLSLPDLNERRFILKIHAKGKPFSTDLNWEKVAKQTVGFSGADLENMLNEAAIAAARSNRDAVTMADIEEAAMKVKMGPSKKRLVDEEERSMTAYHEAGHALVAHFSKYADPVSRISILSRGNALGFTFTPPEKDKLQITKSELLDQIALLLGGRSAEQLVFKELTAGASSDIERATRLATAMVVEYGMSELGPVNMGPQYDATNYSRAWMEPSKVSDKLQEKVDQEVHTIITQAQEKANQILLKYRKILDLVSEKLLEVETLDADDFAQLVGTPKVVRAAQVASK